MENCIQNNPGTFQIFSNALWPLQFSRPQRTICLGTMWTFSFHIFRWHSDFLEEHRVHVCSMLQRLPGKPFGSQGREMWILLPVSRLPGLHLGRRAGGDWAGEDLGWVNGPLPRHWSIPNSFLFSAFKTSSVFHSSHLGFSSPMLRIYSSAM